ncbi:MAG: hypothetical protein CM15mP130_2860 [Verrucomicrobiota bacterium]|nr:MAG: hypothetical protein CM15mP130_2860 [Verrucomicrobiota bacterium]
MPKRVFTTVNFSITPRGHRHGDWAILPRNPDQRETGWPLNSWSEETPFPNPILGVTGGGKQTRDVSEWAGLPIKRGGNGRQKRELGGRTIKKKA